jgi:carbamoyl-phosphate synthase large subunit
MRLRKVLILGSGALKVGQAGEFDYSGSQAIKALKEEGITTVLVNPNIATIQTSEGLADDVYFLPVTADFVERVIERERPCGILLGFGGQTALNCGLELFERGVLERYSVRVLGTPLEAVRATEDRQCFADVLQRIDLKTPIGRAVSSVAGAIDVAEEVGYPLMVRVAFALGGQGSGMVRDRAQLEGVAGHALSGAPQIRVEEYLEGWKEVEYEVIRDCHDNCVTVCNMENFDALGIHTGESIVVAPSQTLSNEEYHYFRSISIRLVRHLGVIGECNVQFALDPKSLDYRIIEVNARLSRSSALASKATGYPLAFVAAKLALGKSLVEVTNAVTGVTSSCFEPALDYVVVKMPRWDMTKFRQVSKVLGSEMKSVGEVMGIGRRFEEALQKACRMLNLGYEGVISQELVFDELEDVLRRPTDQRLFAIAEALSAGIDVSKIQELTKVDAWFLERIREIVECAGRLTEHTLGDLPAAGLRRAKELGFSDRQIAMLLQWGAPPALGGEGSLDVRQRRIGLDIIPCIKQIDTLAAEYPAKTNYLYLTYGGRQDDFEPTGAPPYVVLGGGPYSIGSSVEFDWCCVNAAQTLARCGQRTVMINCNPETVSTDYDCCDGLYFEELSLERVLDICDRERPAGVLVSVGGQVPNNLAGSLHKAGLRIAGTSVESIDGAENRERFSALLDELDVDQPDWRRSSSFGAAVHFAKEVGYPVLIRPSYVLSGAAMSVAHSDGELEGYLQAATRVSPEHPVVLSKFLANAKEIDLDGVAQNGELIAYAISEHVENAGVHSGDATLVFPPQKLYLETIRRIKVITRQIARALAITGPFNLQFIARDNQVKVIECNLRASRSFPFVSKVSRLNLIDLAVRCIMGLRVNPPSRSAFDLDYVGVKAPQFSFSRLKGADPLLGVEMASTGEVGCLGDSVAEANLKALLSVGYTLPKVGVLLSTGPLAGKVALLEAARRLDGLGLQLYATAGTHRFLTDHGVDAKLLHRPLEDSSPNCVSAIAAGKVDLVINIPKSLNREELTNGYLIRRAAVDYGVNLFTNVEAANLFVSGLCLSLPDDLKIKRWRDYT